MCILINGQIAKEFADGTTLIPFGSEYTIRFRNKNSRRAVVKFSIDGEDAGGDGYIIPANDYVDIKRYSHKDVAFKFVDLDSQEAIDFGKNGDNKDKTKGVVEAKFYLEKEIKYYTYNNSIPVYWVAPRRSKNIHGGHSHSWENSHPYKYEMTCSTPDSYDVSSAPESVLCSSPASCVGVTVEGSQTGQSFSYQHIDLENDYVVLKTCLKGVVTEVVPVAELEKQNEKLKLEIMEKQNEKLRLEILKEENRKLKEELERLKNS